jgi:uncharacterized membrane protein
MKFIIPIFILFICFACNSNSKSDTSTKDSVSTNTETSTEVKIKNESITIGTDSVLFKSFGTEPFWSVEIRKSGVLFSNFEDSTVFAFVEPVSASSRPVEYFMTYFLEDQNGNKAQLVAKKGENCPCSDGMSDNDYQYHVSFLYKNQMWEGCGSTVTSEQ